MTLPASDEPGDVAGAYDHWSQVYDADENPTRDLDAAMLRRLDFDLRDRDVLEIGCGTGKNTVWLAERARSVVAMDFSAGMLAQARRRIAAPHVRFVHHDVREPWPVADGSADFAIGNLVLEHVEALDGVFAETARALRDGGECYFCELHPYRQLLGKQARFVHPETGETVRVAAFPHDVSDYVNAAIRAGLRIVAAHEWRDEAPAATPAIPRLFALRCRRQPR
ncbi:methyltransferase [Mizugakiibacter sediminis]|uniref:Methyltransferase n=1 Tax=Mizugakiibacter sediminis TaxID=1475481 RepID=A0A0K8QNB6_9GAMM|nr:class I SAM-dependent methyltransferase [Mizugakiibacter sediminis]GAP65927.1 methyltransferase [Mizugakiibacter sediminis]